MSKYHIGTYSVAGIHFFIVHWHISDCDYASYFNIPSLKSCLDCVSITVHMPCLCPAVRQWLYSAVRALVCIRWQTGFSAPLVLPVMMSHVPVYQTGHTQLSPHLLLSQSPIPLPPVFIFRPLHRASLSFTTRHTHCLFLSFPRASNAPQDRLHLYLQTRSHKYMCACAAIRCNCGCVTALQSAKGKPGLR